MYRDALQDLTTWFHGSHRKPLIIRGARQVGKSTLVSLFAAEMGLTLHTVNLERNLYLDELFRTGDMGRILSEIEGLTQPWGSPGSTLLFLDEIQATPHAIQFLRYFYEERPDLPVIAAGSLLEFTLADHRYSMPVGRVVYYHLGPMTFGEFLHECDAELFAYWNTFQWNQQLPESYHARLSRRHREYLFCGGMPEAVQLFSEIGLQAQIADIHRSILETYEDDFAKYARRDDLIRLQQIFRAIPAWVGRKVIYSRISREDRAAQTRSAIEMLAKARTCTQVFHSDCSGIPIDAGEDRRIFKLLFLDCGLMNYRLGLSWRHLQALEEFQLVNEGALAEQFIGQELLAVRNRRDARGLHYWLREGRDGNAEVDYVIDHEGEILPIEVKAGKSGRLKSLHQFMHRKGGSHAFRFNMHLPSREEVLTEVSLGGQKMPSIRFQLHSFPLYFVGRLEAILGNIN